MHDAAKAVRRKPKQELLVKKRLDKRIRRIGLAGAKDNTTIYRDGWRRFPSWSDGWARRTVSVKSLCVFGTWPQESKIPNSLSEKRV